MFVYAKYTDFVEGWGLGDHRNEHGQQVEEQGLPSVVAAMNREHEGHYWHRRKELSGWRPLHAVVELLPESQLVILALVCVHRRALHEQTENRVNLASQSLPVHNELRSHLFTISQQQRQSTWGPCVTPMGYLNSGTISPRSFKNRFSHQEMQSHQRSRQRPVSRNCD